MAIADGVETIAHLALHFLVPGLVAWGWYRETWRIAFLIKGSVSLEAKRTVLASVSSFKNMSFCFVLDCFAPSVIAFMAAIATFRAP